MFYNDVKVKRLGRPLNRIEEFKLSWKKKDDTSVNTTATHFFNK